MTGWFLTCFAEGEDYVDEMNHMLATFREHHPDVPAIIGINPLPDMREGWGEITNYKASWCRRVWAEFSADLGAMLWIDADARVMRRIEPPRGPGGKLPACAATWGRHWNTGTVWFHGPEVGPLLEEWERLADGSVHDEEAFNAALRKVKVKPLCLQPKFSSVCSRAIGGYRGVREHDSAIIHWNRSRKVLGHIDKWPPNEQERMR